MKAALVAAVTFRPELVLLDEPVAVVSADDKGPIPRTSDGHPDLQGNWGYATLTTLERHTTRLSRCSSAGRAARGGTGRQSGDSYTRLLAPEGEFKHSTKRGKTRHPRARRINNLDKLAESAKPPSPVQIRAASKLMAAAEPAPIGLRLRTALFQRRAAWLQRLAEVLQRRTEVLQRRTEVLQHRTSPLCRCSGALQRRSRTLRCGTNTRKRSVSHVTSHSGLLQDERSML